jgi:TatD DNase family protein
LPNCQLSTVNCQLLVDTHCHLYHRDYDADREAVIARAAAAGVAQMVVIGYDLSSSEAAVRLANGDPRLFATVGIHPHDAATLDEVALGRLRQLAADPRVVAVGEIGLDFYRNLSPREHQERAFRVQVELARELALPIVLHTRESDAEVLALLEEWREGDYRGILHCFGNDAATAERAFELGLHVGIGGVLTFKNARALQETVRSLPLDRIVLETDCPYLAPHPFRGKRNEPAYVPLIAAKLAELHERPVEEVAATSTANARRLFPTMGTDEPRLRGVES